MKPTEEEIKRFWEWCGFYYRKDKDPLASFWETKDGRAWGYELPRIDLNNLFKYAVPKYIDEKCFTLHIDDIEAFDYLCADWKEGILKTAENVGKRAYKLHFDLALFWAIYKVLPKKE